VNTEEPKVSEVERFTPCALFEYPAVHAARTE